MNIYDVLEYGPIVAQNEEFGVLITVNGAYFNVWIGRDGRFENVEAISFGNNSDGLYGQEFVKVMDRAQVVLAEFIADNFKYEEE
jgi:hypothetical protein